MKSEHCHPTQTAAETSRMNSPASSLEHFERHLSEFLDRKIGHDGPRTLANAIRHAVFPGGARLRPSLVLAIAKAYGEPKSPLCLAAATSVELLHCGSLVHDDLPCFDDATLRRGKPSIHTLFGEAIAVLTGDALVTLAFSSLSDFSSELGLHELQTALRMGSALGEAAGPRRGIVAGQAWESEPTDLYTRECYHDAKTGALFTFAGRAAAMACNQADAPWADFGARVGQLYQQFDDLLDVASSSFSGKSNRHDVRHQRPSFIDGMSTRERLQSRIEALRSGFNTLHHFIPACDDPTAISRWSAVLRRRFTRLVDTLQRECNELS